MDEQVAEVGIAVRVGEAREVHHLAPPPVLRVDAQQVRPALARDVREARAEHDQILRQRVRAEREALLALRRLQVVDREHAGGAAQQVGLLAEGAQHGAALRRAEARREREGRRGIEHAERAAARPVAARDEQPRRRRPRGGERGEQQQRRRAASAPGEAIGRPRRPARGSRGCQRWRASATRPCASKRTPSRSSSTRWSRSGPGSERGLISPRALSTRCHGTRASRERRERVADLPRLARKARQLGDLAIRGDAALRDPPHHGVDARVRRRRGHGRATTRIASPTRAAPGSTTRQ